MSLISKRSYAYGFFIPVSVLSVLILGCAPPKHTNEKVGRIIQRIPSPNGKVEAVLSRNDPGAISPFIYHIYTVATGESPKKGWEVFTATRIKGLELIWLNNDTLLVRYDRAKIYTFSSIGDVPNVPSKGYFPIKVILAPRYLVSDAAISRLKDRLGKSG